MCISNDFFVSNEKKRAATKCGYKTKQSTYTLIHKREESAYQAEHSERIYMIDGIMHTQSIGCNLYNNMTNKCMQWMHSFYGARNDSTSAVSGCRRACGGEASIICMVRMCSMFWHSFCSLSLNPSSSVTVTLAFVLTSHDCLSHLVGLLAGWLTGWLAGWPILTFWNTWQSSGFVVVFMHDEYIAVRCHFDARHMCSTALCEPNSSVGASKVIVITEFKWVFRI